MVLDPIPQSLPVHFFGSRPQPPTVHSSHVNPQTEEIGLKIITTAKISNEFSRESPYISNTSSGESPNFQKIFRVSKRSPRHSKENHKIWRSKCFKYDPILAWRMNIWTIYVTCGGEQSHMNESCHTWRLDCAAPAGPCGHVSHVSECDTPMLYACWVLRMNHSWISLYVRSLAFHMELYIYINDYSLLTCDVTCDVFTRDAFHTSLLACIHSLSRHMHTPAVQLHQELQHMYILTIWHGHPQLHCINFSLYIQALWRHVYIPALQFHQGLPHRYILTTLWLICT